MQTPRVALYYCAKTENGWKRLPAAIGRNGKVRPRYAQVGSGQKLYPQGHYEIRYRDDDERKMVWRNVGEDATEAQTEQILKAKRLAAKTAADEAGIKIEEVGQRPRLADKAKAYRDRQEARGKTESTITFENVIAEFQGVANVKYLDELTEQIILRWYAALRKRGNSDRTINNKHTSLFGFLRWCGVDTKKLAERAPEYTEKKVEIYEPDELKRFFDSLTKPYHRVVFEVLLKTGLRMQEAMFLEWHNVNFNRGVMTVTEKDNLGFEVKDRAERTVPIPTDLLERLNSLLKKSCL